MSIKIEDYKEHIRSLGDEGCSAFAFQVAQEIEEIIKEKTNDLESKNKILEAKIIKWYLSTKDVNFAKYFKIKRSPVVGLDQTSELFIIR